MKKGRDKDRERQETEKETRDKYCDILLDRTGWMLTVKEAPDWPAKQADIKNDKEIMKYECSN